MAYCLLRIAILKWNAKYRNYFLKKQELSASNRENIRTLRHGPDLWINTAQKSETSKFSKEKVLKRHKNRLKISVRSKNNIKVSKKQY